MSYHGTTTFDFEIERYKDKISGELLAFDKLTREEDEYEYQTITLNVEGSSYFQPGKFYGPPENCYPDEGEIEILSVMGPDNKDWEDKLTDKEVEQIEQEIDERVQSDIADDFDDFDDSLDDFDR
jgi:hypothetical protein